MAARVDKVHERIAGACKRCGRDPASVTLVGVSKRQPIEVVQPVVDTGVTILGESRVQEAEEKAPRLSGVMELHMIGRLQRNKAKRAVALFDVIHGVDRLSLAQTIQEAAAASGKVQRIYVQVNLGAESQKGGVAPEEAATLLQAIRQMPNLRVEGLMAIPPFTDDPETTRAYFQALATLAMKLQPTGRPLGLSMGMSSDYEIAIEEGATAIRVGTALFGQRPD